MIMLEVSVIGYLIPPLAIYHLYSGGQFYWGVCFFFFHLFARLISSVIYYRVSDSTNIAKSRLFFLFTP
jgi:hypothetical protein